MGVSARVHVATCEPSGRQPAPLPAAARTALGRRVRQWAGAYGTGPARTALRRQVFPWILADYTSETLDLTNPVRP